MEINYNDVFFGVILALFYILILLILFIAFVSWLNKFSQELKYLKSEISRTHGEERKYWINKNATYGFLLYHFLNIDSVLNPKC